MYQGLVVRVRVCISRRFDVWDIALVGLPGLGQGYGRVSSKGVSLPAGVVGGIALVGLPGLG